MTESHTVAIITLPGFNEIDSFVAARMIDSVPGLAVTLVGPGATAVSAAGIEVATPGDWAMLGSCAAVIIGSGMQTFDHIENEEMMETISKNLTDVQFVGSQCSGAAILHRLGFAPEGPLCTDRMTAPKLEELGVEISVEPFRAVGSTASSGGCLSSTYLGYWIIDQLAGRDAADLALLKVVPVGEEIRYQDRVNALIGYSL